MSVEEKAKEAITMIDNQTGALEEIGKLVEKNRDTGTAFEKLKRWKSRTIRLLSEKVNPDEGKELEGKTMTSITIGQPLLNLANESIMYLSFLKSLREELEEHPEDYFSIPIPSEEKVTIPKVSESASVKTVFVVHGRNDKLRVSMFNFLRALGLNPLEWSQAIQATQKASPYIGEILDTAFAQAQAIIVLFSGDDEARLLAGFLGQNEKSYEKELTPQPRPNVIFEAGMAMGRDEDRTILVQVGEIRPISDIAGRHITRLDNSAQKRQELVTKLSGTGCEVDTSGADWLSVGDFEELEIKQTPNVKDTGSFMIG